MNNPIMNHEQHTVNGSFVPPVSGRELYMRGKPITACETDAQAQEWLATEDRCRCAYYDGVDDELRTYQRDPSTVTPLGRSLQAYTSTYVPARNDARYDDNGRELR